MFSGLRIPVDDAGFVCRFERVTHLPRDVHGEIRRELPLLLDEVPELETLQILVDDVGTTVSRVSEVVHADHVRMIDAGGGVGLALEARSHLRAGGHLGAQDFDRVSLAGNAGVVRFEHQAHAALAEQAVQDVGLLQGGT